MGGFERRVTLGGWLVNPGTIFMRILSNKIECPSIRVLIGALKFWEPNAWQNVDKCIKLP